MTQYINLYDDSLRPRRELLTLNNVAIALATTLVLVIALAAYGMTRTADERRAARAVELRLQEMQAQVTVFAVQQGARQLDPLLQQQLAAAESRLANRRAVLARVQNGGFGGQQGFAGIFRGLAEVSEPGVWLTAIDLRAEGQAMALHGRMLNEAQLPAYVARLSAHPRFSGRLFSALDVQRVSADKPAESAAALPPHVRFTLNGLPAERQASAGGGQ